MAIYLKTERTTPLRYPDRASYDVDVVNPILDEALVCHVGFVGPDGSPRVLPTLHVRVDDTLYLHGSTGSRTGLAAREGDLPVCVTVTLIDGLVFAGASVVAGMLVVEGHAVDGLHVYVGQQLAVGRPGGEVERAGWRKQLP